MKGAKRQPGIEEAITALAETGTGYFTVAELADRLGLARDRARHLAYRMVNANRATRVRRGLYAVLPPADWRRPGATPGDWYATAAHLADPDPYYLAYYTAMEVHRMLQHPLRTVFIALTKRRRNVDIGPVKFRFVHVAEPKFFGAADLVVGERRTARAADLERTFLDCMDRPELCGGYEEVFRGFRRKQADLNKDRILRYAMRLNQPVLAKRLGFMLELTGLGEPEVFWELERMAGRLGHYVPFQKGQPAEGAPRNRRWELLVNVNTDMLRKADQA